jgi:antirestriction protein ArdC
MNIKPSRLAERRERLVALADLQRTALTQAIEPWRAPLALADHGLAVLRAVRRHPAWLVGGIVLLVVWRPGRAGTWLRRGWVTWRIARKLLGG